MPRLTPLFALTAAILLLLSSSIFYLVRPSYVHRLFAHRESQAEMVVSLNSMPLLPSHYSTHYPSLMLPEELAAYPELYVKLHDFLSRPIYGHQEAVDLEINSKGCPYELSDKLVNPDQLNGDGGFWRKDVEPMVIIKKRVELVKSLLEVMATNRPLLGNALPLTTPSGQPNRGLVITGGNKDTTARLITLLKILRHQHHCELPVEVFHFPGEMTDEREKDEIRGLGAEIKEITDTKKDEGAWKSFNIKGLAITHSSFRELIYLDSDNIPLRSPSHLFSSPKYNAKNSGRAVFYPDLSKDHTDNAVWRLIGEPCTLDLWTFESGQILIDKAGNNGLNLAALHLAAHMQHDNSFWFHLCGGDKDTFRWGFRALDLPFTHSPRWLSPLGSLHQAEGGRFCGHTILQYDIDIPEGADREPPLFVHSNLLKHISGLQRGDTFTTLKRAAIDNYSEPSLNHAHQWVRWADGRGMCTDIEFTNSEAEQLSEHQSIIEIPLKEMKEFDGFDEYWWESGGRAGGWRKRRLMGNETN